MREKTVRNESLIENHESWQLHVIVDCTCCILDIILSGSNFSFMHINFSDQKKTAVTLDDLVWWYDIDIPIRIDRADDN